MDHKKKLIQDLMDEIVWSPTRAEIKAIYPKHRHKQMQKFYKETNARKVELLKSLREEVKKQVREETICST